MKFIYDRTNIFTMGFNTQEENEIGLSISNSYFIGMGKGEWKDY